MLYIDYTLLRLRRFWKQSVTAILVFAALQLALSAADGSRAAVERELDELKNNTPITVTMINSSGKDDALNIPKKTLDDFLSPAGALTPYIKNIRLFTSLHLLAFEGAGEKLQQEAAAAYPRLYGINRIDADPMFRAQIEPEITFMSGYSEACFAGDEAVCVVSGELLAELGKSPGDSITLTLRSGRLDFSIEKTDIRYTFTIVGTAAGVPPYNVYCPWRVAAECALLSDGQEEYARYLSFELKNPSELETFKEIAFARYLDGGALYSEEPSAAGKASEKLALRVQDDLYLRASQPLEENVRTLKRLIPFLYALAAGCGLAAGLVLTFKRRHEFAILAGIGFQKSRVFFMVALEYLLLTVCGLIAGGGAYFLITGNPPAFTASVILTALTLAGALLSAAPLMRSRLIQRIKSKE